MTEGVNTFELAIIGSGFALVNQLLAYLVSAMQKKVSVLTDVESQALFDTERNLRVAMQVQASNAQVIQVLATGQQLMLESQRGYLTNLGPIDAFRCRYRFKTRLDEE